MLKFLAPDVYKLGLLNTHVRADLAGPIDYAFHIIYVVGWGRP
jgi:hypothetical protein